MFEIEGLTGPQAIQILDVHSCLRSCETQAICEDPPVGSVPAFSPGCPRVGSLAWKLLSRWLSFLSHGL